MAVSAMVEDSAWLGKLRGELCALIAPVFAQARSRFAAFAYVAALLAVTGDRKSGAGGRLGGGGGRAPRGGARRGSRARCGRRRGRGAPPARGGGGPGRAPRWAWGPPPPPPPPPPPHHD